jgi:hypothetical protein
VSNFKVLNNLPTLDLYKEFCNLINSGKISWFTQSNGNVIKDQICVNTVLNNEDNIYYGRGSLIYDWDKFYHDENGTLKAPEREFKLKEEYFKVLCTPFKNTLFEEMYNVLNKHYRVGRIRIMNSKPKTCLTWHIDDTQRLHYPMKTQDGCFMIIENEVKHLEKNVWYHTNTFKYHTAFNGSKDERLHLVVNILGEK